MMCWAVEDVAQHEGFQDAAISSAGRKRPEWCMMAVTGPHMWFETSLLACVMRQKRQQRQKQELN